MREHERRTLFAVDPLRHSRRPFGGMWADIKKLVRRYPSDLRDMFHIQVRSKEVPPTRRQGGINRWKTQGISSVEIYNLRVLEAPMHVDF